MSEPNNHDMAQEEPKAKKKLNLNRVDMPRQDPVLRGRNFNEVATGYTEEQAVREASRCIHCKKPLCVPGCPVDVDIPRFILQIKNGDFSAAIRTLKEKNSLPAVCGRVCPQEEQCEKVCILGKKGEPVAIGRLERFAADRALMTASVDAVSVPSVSVPSGKKVAVIGAGPAGLTAAGELAKLGHAVTLFEALHKPGGVLVYGIPEFRLPKAIVETEIRLMEELGVTFVTNALIGRAMTIEELLKDGFSAVFVGAGAGLPNFMGIPGENLNGVYSANEFLTLVNLMKAYLFPE